MADQLPASRALSSHLSGFPPSTSRSFQLPQGCNLLPGFLRFRAYRIAYTYPQPYTSHVAITPIVFSAV